MCLENFVRISLIAISDMMSHQALDLGASTSQPWESKQQI